MQSRGQGYTIIEVMIFLAVSAAMFLSAMLLMQGQQTRTEFSQGMRDIESRFRDTLNDVSSGYYPEVNGFTCDATGTTIQFDQAATDTTGTNLSCIFMGKAIQALPAGNSNALITHVVVGKRLYSSAGVTRDVQTLAEARPTAVYDSAFNLDYSDTYQLPWGIKLKSVVSPTNSSMLGVYGSLAKGQQPDGAQQSGAQDLAPTLYSLTANASPDQARACIGDTAGCVMPGGQFPGWQLCFSRVDNKETALISVGGEGSTTTVKLDFEDC